AQFNWRVALDYTIDPDLMVYVNVATGFKSGGFNGSFLNATPDPVAVEAQLNPIKPENNTAYEVGVKSTWLDHRLLFNSALFYNDYREEQVFILVPIAPLLAINVLTNARRAHEEGADVEVIGKPIDNLTLTAQLGLLQAKIDSDEGFHGRQLPLAPHVTLST